MTQKKSPADKAVAGYKLSRQSLRSKALLVLKAVQAMDATIPQYDGDSADLDLQTGDLDLVCDSVRRVQEHAHELARYACKLQAEVMDQLITDWRGY